MDQFVVDVGDLPSPSMTRRSCSAPGRTSRARIDWADAIGTIHYEIVTRIGPRVPPHLPGRRGMKRGGLWLGAAAAGVAAAGTALAVDQTRAHDPAASRPVATSRRRNPTAQASCAPPTACSSTTSRTARRTPPLTVVLVHGFCQNRDDLLFQRRALIDEFGARVRVVSFDLRSHGRSSRRRAEHATIDQLGTDSAPGAARAGPGRTDRADRPFDGRHDDPRARRRPARGCSADRVAGVALISTSTGKIAWVTLGVPAGLAKVGDPALRLAMRGVIRRSSLLERGRARLTDASWLFVRRWPSARTPTPRSSSSWRA